MDLVSRREREIRTHDSEHDIGLAVEGDGPVDHRGISRELAAPEPVAQHRDLVPSRGPFLGEERAPQDRLHSEEMEELGGGPNRR